MGWWDTQERNPVKGLLPGRLLPWATETWSCWLLTLGQSVENTPNGHRGEGTYPSALIYQRDWLHSTPACPSADEEEVPGRESRCRSRTTVQSRCGAEHTKMVSSLGLRGWGPVLSVSVTFGLPLQTMAESLNHHSPSFCWAQTWIRNSSQNQFAMQYLPIGYRW